MINLAVFDWNGTLLADGVAIIEGVNKEIGVVGHAPITFSQYQQHYDMPLSAFYDKLGIDSELVKKNAAKMSQAFHSHYEPRVAKARTRRGARQLLNTFQASQITNIVLSNHTNEGISLQLERLKLRPFFGAILANDDIYSAGTHDKQDRLKAFLVNDSFDASRAVIIGDTVEEIRIGQHLGMKTIAISGGYNSLSRLQAAKPDIIVHSLNDIVKIVKGW